MPHVLLVQLPVPQLNFGRQTGNIPFGAACLHQAAAHLDAARIDILPQTIASYSGDAALLDLIIKQKPDIIGFTVYLWNVQRTRRLCREIKRHYTPRIVLGGPEVTPDNPLIKDDAVDFHVFGEGETLFARLLQEPDLWRKKNGRGNAFEQFKTASSPYLSTPLTPGLEKTMLLETMRGCPYHCAYCFYNKSHAKPAFKQTSLVLEGVAWARNQPVNEIYLLDPALNSRPELKHLLKEIALLNKDQRLTFISEIRAESIDEELADLLAATGFKWLEVGLQSTNPAALAAMRRRTDLDRFAAGVRRLEQRGITPTVDLIVGLPGDDPQGFDRTTRFVLDNAFHSDIQIFPLALIPGTEFRQKHQSLGLIFENDPPYTVISTPSFSEDDILEALDMAEERFDTALYPLPDLDLAYHRMNAYEDIDGASDITVGLEEIELVCKVVLRKGRTPADIEATARRVTHPYQLIVPPSTTLEEAADALTRFTAMNPFTPLEMVFFAPDWLPDVDQMLTSARLARPHYLDIDLRPLYAEPGNRTVLFTVVSDDQAPLFSGPMQRHIFWWKKSPLPDRKTMDGLEEEGFDGILIDASGIDDQLHAWQDGMARVADELMLIAFADTSLHKRWLEKTADEDYCLQILP